MENKEFLSYDQCVALSELTYDGDYDFVYHVTGEIWERGKKDKKERFLPSPLKQQVFRWFREKYDLDSYIFWWLRKVGWGYDIRNDSSVIKQTNDNTFTSYEEAENACIDKLIEIAKNES